jgi:hypothetical protein
MAVVGTRCMAGAASIGRIVIGYGTAGPRVVAALGCAATDRRRCPGRACLG